MTLTLDDAESSTHDWTSVDKPGIVASAFNRLTAQFSETFAQLVGIHVRRKVWRRDGVGERDGRGDAPGGRACDDLLGGHIHGPHAGPQGGLTAVTEGGHRTQLTLTIRHHRSGGCLPKLVVGAGLLTELLTNRLTPWVTRVYQRTSV
jgi:hypothetical protein